MHSGSSTVNSLQTPWRRVGPHALTNGLWHLPRASCEQWQLRIGACKLLPLEIQGALGHCVLFVVSSMPVVPRFCDRVHTVEPLVPFGGSRPQD